MLTDPKNLVPLKVKIGLRPNGHADHPNWYQLPLAFNGERPEDHMFGGWHYDKSSGHRESSPDSPLGMQWGVMLVSQKLAQEALTIWPDKMSKISEAEFEDFWENRAYAHLTENKVDHQTLASYNDELSLRTQMGQDTTELKKRLVKALDPNDPERGIRKNNMRHYADFKKDCGITIVP